MVIPSRQDNLPNTGLEAHACVIPVVAFNTGACPASWLTASPVRWLSLLSHPLAAAVLWVFEDSQRASSLEPQLADLVSRESGWALCGH